MTVQLLEENVEYKKLSGIRSKYDLYEVNGVKVTRDKSEILFEERYRPRKIFDLIVSNEISDKLTDWVNNETLPHLLFYSQQGGTGKTSISGVLANELGWDTLPIAANIDRGIQVIKDKVVTFSQNKSMFGKPKIVSIEEFGDSTPAQIDSFKSVIDIYGKNIRVIMTTNTMTKVSQPLKTRLTILDFNKVSEEQQNELFKKIFARLKAILLIENVQHTDNDIAVLMKKYKFSYRELLAALGSCIIDNKLDVTKLIANTSADLDGVLKLINDNNIAELAKICGSINHIQIIEELSDCYLEKIQDVSMIQPFIMRLNDCQNQLALGVAFPEISALDMFMKMIQDKIKFKV